MSKFSKEKEQEIVNMYIKGLSQVEIAKYFNTFNTSIRRVLKRNNIKIF
jgi:DNA invertase Pin-like site-specific DNA recombinase